jgi:hypothetical protein
MTLGQFALAQGKDVRWASGYRYGGTTIRYVLSLQTMVLIGTVS